MPQQKKKLPTFGQTFLDLWLSVCRISPRSPRRRHLDESPIPLPPDVGTPDRKFCVSSPIALRRVSKSLNFYHIKAACTLFPPSSCEGRLYPTKETSHTFSSSFFHTFFPSRSDLVEDFIIFHPNSESIHELSM